MDAVDVTQADLQNGDARGVCPADARKALVGAICKSPRALVFIPTDGRLLTFGEARLP
jgi:hypothetical protein